MIPHLGSCKIGVVKRGVVYYSNFKIDDCRNLGIFTIGVCPKKGLYEKHVVLTGAIFHLLRYCFSDRATFF